MKNDYTTKSKLQTQCNAHQNPNVILYRNKKVIKFMWKNKRPQVPKVALSKKGIMLEESQYQTSNYTTEL
jgi:hypothetical protein